MIFQTRLSLLIFKFQETTFAEKVEEDNLEDNYGRLEALGKDKSTERKALKACSSIT